MVVSEVRAESYQRWSRVLGVKGQEPMLMKRVQFLAKKRLGGFHDLFFIKSNLSESEVICWLARVFVHEPGPDCRSEERRVGKEC